MLPNFPDGGESDGEPTKLVVYLEAESNEDGQPYTARKSRKPVTGPRTNASGPPPPAAESRPK